MRRLRRVGSRGDALADLAEAGDELRDVTVFGIVRWPAEIPDHGVRVRWIGDASRGPDVLHDRAVALLRPRAREQAIGDDAPLQRFVLVVVRRDEARHHDRAGAVDDFRIARGHGWCDLGNLLPVDQHIRFLEVADLRIETEHDAAAQQDAPLAPVADKSLEIRRRRRAKRVSLSRARLSRFASAARRGKRGRNASRSGLDEFAPCRAHRRYQSCSLSPAGTFRVMSTMSVSPSHRLTSCCLRRFPYMNSSTNSMQRYSMSCAFGSSRR